MASLPRLVVPQGLPHLRAEYHPVDRGVDEDREPGEVARLLAALAAAPDLGTRHQLAGALVPYAHLPGVLDAIAQHGPRGLAAWALCEKLGDSDPRAFADAEACLSALGAAALPPLCDRLSHADAHVRETVASLITRIGEPAARLLAQRLAEEPGQPDPDKLRVLEIIGRPAIPATCRLLRESTDPLRAALVGILGRIGDGEAIPPLIELLAARHEGAAAALAAIAGRVADVRLRGAVPLLEEYTSPWNLELLRGGAAFRAALEAIQEATGHLDDVPLPAGAPSADPSDLPLPAGAAAPSPDRMPIPAGPPTAQGESRE